MADFKKVRLGTNLGGMTFYRLAGLPDGESCILAPEDGEKPRGEWYAAVKRGGRQRTIRCKSLDAAKAAAIKWSASRGKKKARGAAR